MIRMIRMMNPISQMVFVSKETLTKTMTKKSEQITQIRQAKEAAQIVEEQKEFDFETAERSELKGTFIQQGEIIF